MKEDKVADVVADMVAVINIDMEIQFGDNFFDPKLTLLAHLLSFARIAPGTQICTLSI